LEERQALYPTFPLKVILTAGGHHYAGQVFVHIADERDHLLVTIPPEHVTGRWIFVDIPHGNYRVSASDRAGVTVRQNVRVGKSATTLVYLGWSRDTGG
jgi:hypothetical protein